MRTKRKTSGGAKRRTTTARATNAPKRRRSTRRAGNPSPRRRFGARRSVRRRNPSSAITSGITLGAASAVVEVVQGIVSRVGGDSLAAGAIRSAATGFLLGKAAQQFAATRKYAEPLQVAGVAIGAAKLVSYYVAPHLRRALSSVTGAGMQGIGVMPTPSLPARTVPAKTVTAPAGVNGIGVMSFNP